MRRWHYERALMLRRARVNLNNRHELGHMRKRRPLGCGNPQCGLCHWGKVYDGGYRRRDLTKTFEQEWAGSGGW